MVKDAMSAIDFLYCRSEAGRKNASCASGFYPDQQPRNLDDIPVVDMERVYILGYSLGGNVALHTAALDSRVKVRSVRVYILPHVYIIILLQYIQ